MIQAISSSRSRAVAESQSAGAAGGSRSTRRRRASWVLRTFSPARPLRGVRTTALLPGLRFEARPSILGSFRVCSSFFLLPTPARSTTARPFESRHGRRSAPRAANQLKQRPERSLSPLVQRTPSHVIRVVVTIPSSPDRSVSCLRRKRRGVICHSSHHELRRGRREALREGMSCFSPRFINPLGIHHILSILCFCDWRLCIFQWQTDRDVAQVESLAPPTSTALLGRSSLLQSVAYKLSRDSSLLFVTFPLICPALVLSFPFSIVPR